MPCAMPCARAVSGGRVKELGGGGRAAGGRNFLGGGRLSLGELISRRRRGVKKMDLTSAPGLSLCPLSFLACSPGGPVPHQAIHWRLREKRR